MPIFSITSPESPTRLVEADTEAQAREFFIGLLMRPIVGEVRTIPGMTRDEASSWFSYNCSINESADLFAVLSASMDPKPIAHYTQYKIASVADPLKCVTMTHPDDEKTDLVGTDVWDLLDLVSEKLDLPLIGEAIRGELADQYGGPLKVVREVVLVFDLNSQEQKQFAEIA